MRLRTRKPTPELLDNLSPWETTFQDCQIGRYVNHLLPHRPPLPCLPRRRTISHCDHPRRQATLSTALRHYEQPDASQDSERQLQTMGQIRGVAMDRRTPERGFVLHELSVKNFVISSKAVVVKKEKAKKRESTYILKQKFAQIRRSHKLVGTNKENLPRGIGLVN